MNFAQKYFFITFAGRIRNLLSSCQVSNIVVTLHLGIILPQAAWIKCRVNFSQAESLFQQSCSTTRDIVRIFLQLCKSVLGYNSSIRKRFCLLELLHIQMYVNQSYIKGVALPEFPQYVAQFYLYVIDL